MSFPLRLLYKLFLLAILCTYLLGLSASSNNEEAEFGLEGAKVWLLAGLLWGVLI
jgi:hypothetical protein